MQVVSWADSMKHVTGRLMPASCPVTAAPRTKTGYETSRANTAQSSRLGAKVLVECYQSANGMRVMRRAWV